MIRSTLLAFAVLASVPVSAQTINDNFNAAIVEFPAVTRSKGTLRTTGTAVAPSLTAAGVHSCAGSSSGGVAGSGFGLSFGTTYEMIGCGRRAYAATLLGMGHNGAALALICNDAEVMAALNQSGVRCPQQAIQRAPAAYAALPARRAPAAARSATPWRD